MANGKNKNGSDAALPQTDLPPARDMLAMEGRDVEMREEAVNDTPAPTVTETKYPRSEHIELAVGMYGEPMHNVAGALSLLDPETDEFTKGEVEAAIGQFHSRELTTDTEGN